MSEWIAPEASRYPERTDPGVGWRQRAERGLLVWPARYRYLWIRRELARLEGGTDRLGVSVDSLRNSIRLEGLTGKSLALWYAWARGRIADRDVIAGALGLIRGMAVQCDSHSSQAEMAACASVAIALSGSAVHVLTPDDTSARELQPVLDEHLQCFGLQTSVIESSSPVPARQLAYRASVTIVSARDALHDYLDDRLRLHCQQGEMSRKLGRLVGSIPLRSARMCGLPFGIIIDANRILIDQACEPMTIAGRTDPAREKAWAESALTLTRGMEEELHYTVGVDQNIQLTEAGRLQLDRSVVDMPGVWRNMHRRNADISLAFKALRLDPGRHYQVVDQRVELTSATSVPDGMIQLLQAREGVPVTGRFVARAKLTFQRFFRRYQRLAALCSDTRYIRDELWQIYGLSSFIAMPGAEKMLPDTSPLSETDKRFVSAVSRFSKSLGRQSSYALAAWRIRRQYRAAEHLRRNLLRLDNQIGNITAFSGRAE